MERSGEASGCWELIFLACGITILSDSIGECRGIEGLGSLHVGTYGSTRFDTDEAFVVAEPGIDVAIDAFEALQEGFAGCVGDDFAFDVDFETCGGVFEQGDEGIEELFAGAGLSTRYQSSQQSFAYIQFDGSG